MKSLTTLFLCLVCFVVVHGQAKKPSKLKKPNPPPEKASTATPVTFLTKSEQDLLTEINAARANPAAFVAILEQFKSNYKGKIIQFADGSSLVTNEGVAALEDAIVFLKTLKPLKPLEVSKGMVAGAKLHLDDLKKTQGSGHLGSDGSKPEDRLTRFGTWKDSVAENIVYNSRSARNDLIGNDYR